MNQPESWNKLQVTTWISKICKDFEIEEDEVSNLKGQNGRGLDSLPKGDWKERSKHGDLFYNEWQKLKSTGSQHKQEEKTTVEPSKQLFLLFTSSIQSSSENTVACKQIQTQREFKNIGITIGMNIYIFCLYNSARLFISG